LHDLQSTFQAKVVRDLAQLRRCTDNRVSIEVDRKLNANGEASTGFEFGDHFGAQAVPDLWRQGTDPAKCLSLRDPDTVGPGSGNRLWNRPAMAHARLEGRKSFFSSRLESIRQAQEIQVS
jgi:hypothetical protein